MFSFGLTSSSEPEHKSVTKTGLRHMINTTQCYDDVTLSHVS